MNQEIPKAAIASLAAELERLRGVWVDRDAIDGCAVPFLCESEATARHIASIGELLLEEYNDKVLAEVILLPSPKLYMLGFSTMDETIDLAAVIISMVSGLDAAACDVPDLYNMDEPLQDYLNN